MAVLLKHTTEAVGTDAGNGEIAKAQWNEAHTLTGTADTLLGFNGSGVAEEISKSNFATTGKAIAMAIVFG